MTHVQLVRAAAALVHAWILPGKKAKEVKMGCGCGKKFSKPGLNVQTPQSVLDEIAKRLKDKQNAPSPKTGSKNAGKNK